MAESAARRAHVFCQHLVPNQTAEPSTLLTSNPTSCQDASGGMLRGKVAIITGSGRGIGAAAAKLFSKHGASIVVSDLDAKASQQVADDITASGGKAISVPVDITSPDAGNALVQATIMAFGSIDILINNAGFTWDGMIHKISSEQWESMLNVHCTAPFRLIQAATPYMREAAKREMESSPDGLASPRSIINISSTTGTHGNVGQANYATAKAGIVGLTKTVAKEWGPFNVRCNAIAYGSIATRLTASKEPGNTIAVGGKQVPLGIPQGDAAMEVLKSTLPLRRIGSADDAAGAMLFLACPWSEYITGQVLEVHGGAYM